jgi:hypothetical protein
MITYPRSNDALDGRSRKIEIATVGSSVESSPLRPHLFIFRKSFPVEFTIYNTNKKIDVVLVKRLRDSAATQQRTTVGYSHDERVHRYVGKFVQSFVLFILL